MLCVVCLISSVHEMDCLGKKLFLCLVVLVLRALYRRPDGNSSKRKCAGCEGSGVNLPALLLTLDKYSSWRVGRVIPMRVISLAYLQSLSDLVNCHLFSLHRVQGVTLKCISLNVICDMFNYLKKSEYFGLICLWSNDRFYTINK